MNEIDPYWPEEPEPEKHRIKWYEYFLMVPVGLTLLAVTMYGKLDDYLKRQGI